LLKEKRNQTKTYEAIVLKTTVNRDFSNGEETNKGI